MKRKIIILFLPIFFSFISIGQPVNDLKKYGNDIIDGKIKPTDDSKTFRILDSILSLNNNDKQFYLFVANKIQLKSDGALSEYVSSVFCKFYLNQNRYFIEFSKKLNDRDIYKWLNYISYEMYANNQSGLNGLAHIKNILDSCNQNTSPNADLIKKYNNYIFKKTKQLIQQD